MLHGASAPLQSRAGGGRPRRTRRTEYLGRHSEIMRDMPGVRPLGVISPHLDDAVLSCGQVIRAHPGSAVVTVFAGRPEDDRIEEWDARYFKPGDAPVPTRRAEDRKACAELGATPIHLDFLDSQYGAAAEDGPISEELMAQVDELGFDTWLVPLGIAHQDHIQTHRAAATIFAARPHVRWVIYEELGYRVEWLQATEEARQRARGRLRLQRRSLSFDPNLGAKERAIRCYRSQLGETLMNEKNVRNALTEEAYWEVL